jgi:hypothetical protein
LISSRKKAQDFTRERKMGFKNLIFFLLTMVKQSSQNALERYFEIKNEDSFMTQQAFSLARQKLKWEALLELFILTVNAHYQNYQSEIKLWNAYRVFANDGSTLPLPNYKELRECFGSCGAGNTSPTARGSLLYDILNNLVVDARIEPMAVDERTLAVMHIDRLAALETFQKWKELILFDRGYASFELIKELIGKNIHYVMRVRSKFSTAIDELGYGDHNVVLQQGEEKIKVRVVKFPLTSEEDETLITDIKEKKYDISAFKALYFKRWPIETKYNEIKNKLEIENFSGRLVDNIRQDFYATMVLTNLAAECFEMAQEGMEEEQKEKDNKWRYKINVNHEIGVLKDKFIKVLLEDDHKKRNEKYEEIIRLLQKRLIPIRPGRSIPRMHPRKVKFHHNHKSNC